MIRRAILYRAATTAAVVQSSSYGATMVTASIFPCPSSRAAAGIRSSAGGGGASHSRRGRLSPPLLGLRTTSTTSRASASAAAAAAAAATTTEANNAFATTATTTSTATTTTSDSVAWTNTAGAAAATTNNQYQHQNKKTTNGLLDAFAGSLAAVLTGCTVWMTAAMCEAPAADKETNVANLQSQQQHATPPNPFWPSGVDSKHVDALVEDCLRDPSINIKAIPDYLERQLYKSTIQLTLNVIYQFLGQLHGTHILAHELQLHRVNITTTTTTTTTTATTEHSLSQLRNDLDEQVLEQMAEKLLANKAVNQALIPDVLERQLYINCLKIVFRLLDLLSATMSISVCGHDFRLTIEPSQRRKLLTQQAEKVLSQGQQLQQSSSSSRLSRICTPIDTDLLWEYAAREAGIDVMDTTKRRSWFARLFQPNLSQQFVVQLHASLYGLLLGLLDDLLEQTSLVLLQDSVQLDLVPVPEQVRLERLQAQAAADAMAEAQAQQSPARGGDSGYLPLASFTMGLGLGLCLMTLAKEYKRFM
ncbi:hypothetical protein ACA910_001888 [Epithemia clementina (nom. ined.)]